MTNNSHPTNPLPTPTPAHDLSHLVRLNPGGAGVSPGARTPPPDRRPADIPGYEILGELGRGGMGVVYRARHLRLNRPVALKVLIAGAHAGEAVKARFKVEAEAAGRLHHPNIVQVYDIGEHAGFEYLALELVEGGSLRQSLAGRPADPRESARLVAAVARGVQHAHENGVLHRDLKPANILLAAGSGQRPAGSEDKTGAGDLSSPPAARCPLPTPTPKVTDFGLAKLLAGGPDLTQTGSACGTPNYMAPEQARTGTTEVGPAADVYGLGAILFECLTGRAPFVGTDPLLVVEQVLWADPPPARALNPAVPRDLELVAAKCLEKDPRRRYPSAAALADELENFLAGRPVAARPVGRVERGARWCRRNPTAAALLGVLTLGFATTAGLSLALWRTAGAADLARGDAERTAAELAVALKDAQDRRTDAERATAAATSSRVEAQAAKALAEENDRLARRAISTALVEIGTDPELARDDLFDLRTKLLAATTPLQQELLRLRPTNPTALAEQAKVLRAIAHVKGQTGDTEGAVADLARAVAILEPLVAAAPNDWGLGAELGGVLLNRGTILNRLGRTADGAALQARAIQVLSQVIRNDPGNARARVELCRAHVNTALNLSGKPERAAHHAAALDHGYEYLRAHGPDLTVTSNLAVAHNNIAAAARLAGRFDEAECHLIEAIAFRRGNIAALPTNPKAKADLCRTLKLYGMLKVQTLKLAEAESLLTEAVTLGRQAAEAAPGTLYFASNLAEAYRLRSRVPFFTNKPAETVDWLDRAAETIAPVLRKEPGNLEFRQVATDIYQNRGVLLTVLARHREAADDWARTAECETGGPTKRRVWLACQAGSLVKAGELNAGVARAEALEREQHEPVGRYELARCWSAAAARAATDEAKAKYAANALASLAAARDAGYFDNPQRRTEFGRDADFAPVRDRFPLKK